MLETRLMVVITRFELCFCHSYVLLSIVFVVSFYCSFINYRTSSAFTIQRACVLSAIARTGVIVIGAVQKVLIVTGDNAFDIGGAAIGYLNGVTVKDFAVF